MDKNLIQIILLGGDGKIGYPDGYAALNSQAYPPSSNIGATAASAASLANVVNAFAMPFSGTAAVTGFRLPRGYRGLFAIIPSGAMTGVTGGTLAYSSDGLTEDIPIAVGFACAANKALLLITDGAKCYPTVLTAAG